MRILVIAKRFGSGKDSVKDNFGRATRLFEEIAKRHEVTVIEADHIKKEEFEATIGKMKAKVVPFSPLKALQFYLRIRKELSGKKHEVIYATSHPAFAAIALLASKIHGIKLAYDLQDNYAAYTKNFILLYFSDKAIKSSCLVSCASEKLAERAGYFNKNTTAVPNGYDKRIAKPMDKKKCRKKLGLPADARIISYTGNIEQRGIEILFKAFEKLRARHKGLRLLLVGSSIRQKYRKEKSEGVIFLDSMPYHELFTAINAADVMALPYAKTEFTELLMAPYKLVEYMACGKPIVISDAGEMQKLAPRFVYKADDADDLASKLEEALKYEKIDYGKQMKELTWEALGKKLEKKLKAKCHP